MGFLMSTIFDAKCMWGLESNTFARHEADFVWMLLLGFVFTCAACCVIPRYFFLGISLRYMVLYYWARRNPFFKVSMYFIPLKATLLPYTLLIISFLTSGESLCLHLLMLRIPWSGIVGLLAGHCYYFARDVIPLVYRHRRKPVPHYTQAPYWL